jgi:hypothetical protein
MAFGRTRATYRKCQHVPQCDYSKRGECVAQRAAERKRVKHVVSSGEVPHLWFHKAQASAKNGTGSFFFEGDTIFSYGRHFAIARHVTSGKRSAVLFTEHNYSNTTSGHKSAVRSAIPEGTLIFHVLDVFRYDRSGNHETNLKYYMECIERHLVTASRARSSYKKEWEHSRAVSLRTEAREYAKFFKQPLPKIAPIPALDSAALANIKKREAKKSAQQAAETKARVIEAVKQEAELLARWRTGEVRNSSLYVSPIALRLTQDKTEVETSRGARIPVDHARRVLAVVRRVVERQEAFVSNGHSIHAGPYKVDRIETNGTLKAGCHTIALAEMELLAPQLEALATTQTPA